MSHVEVITGIERRRRWSAEQKRAIVAAAFAPGAVVRETARRADVCSNQIYRWRRELSRETASGFAEVVVSPVALTSSEVPAIEVGLSNGSQIRIPASIPPELASAVLKALQR